MSSSQRRLRVIPSLVPEEQTPNTELVQVMSGSSRVPRNPGKSPKPRNRFEVPNPPNAKASSRKSNSVKKMSRSKAKKSAHLQYVDYDYQFNPQMTLQGPNTSQIDDNSTAASDKTGTDCNNNPLTIFSRIEIPNGFLPPTSKDSLLSNVLRSARRSLETLKEVRDSLSSLVAEDDHLSKGIKKLNPSPDILQLSLVAEALTILTREAFVPIHRFNQTAIALYKAEDFLRYPKDIRAFDTIQSGRIKLPDSDFNVATVQKLRLVVDNAREYYNKFNLKGKNGRELQDIMFTLMKGFQDLYTTMLGCQDVFKVLLYTNAREKQNLQNFLLSLPSMERSGMLTEVQDLRRVIDELVIFLEKLSWGCFVVYRLSSGQTPMSSTPSASKPGTSSQYEKSQADEEPSSPAEFPILEELNFEQNNKPVKLGKKKFARSSESGKVKPKLKKSVGTVSTKSFGFGFDETESSLMMNSIKQKQVKQKKPKSQVQF